MKRYIVILLSSLAFLTSCENDSWEFPDFDYSAVYFSYQSPVRTITLGEDIYDTSLDNEHKFLIMATLGGVYENDHDIFINVAVDNTLLDSVRFETTTGAKVLPMPAEYYTLPADMRIKIPKGKIIGGIEVQLTQAFFADTLALINSYVIPLVMTSVTNADSILSGRPSVSNPIRTRSSDWSVAPKDYVLYAVKYINPWHGFYLRRGVENVTITANGNQSQFVYRNEFVERDEVCFARTLSLSTVDINLRAQLGDNQFIPFTMVLNFGSNNSFTIAQPIGAAYTINGSGTFVEDGDKWGGQNRNVMHLQYSVDFGTSTHTMTDTLVVRNRGVSFETFIPVNVLP